MDLINKLHLLDVRGGNPILVRGVFAFGSVKNEDPEYGQKVFALLNDPAFEVIDLSLRPFSKSILHYIMHDSCKKSLLYLIALSREPTKTKQVINLDINIRDSLTETSPLYEAAYNKAHECVKILLDMGADPNQADIWGCTPLSAAVMNTDTFLVNILLERGANPNPEGLKGKTPLHIAAKNGNREITKILLDKNVDPNSKDLKGRTPLHIVAKRDKRETMKILLDNNADQFARDNDNLTAEGLAMTKVAKEYQKIKDKVALG